MNDPHVQALIYRVDHDSSVDYEQASPLEEDRPNFRVRVEENRARFEMKDHYATVPEARAIIQPFIDQWEFEASLRGGPGKFSLNFERPEIIDRQPTPGVISVAAHFSAGAPTASVSVTVSKEYPSSPWKGAIDITDPDVQTMHHRYTGYLQNHEPLPSMAYFCYEVFTKRLSENVNDASEKYKISRNLIEEVAKISSIKGGKEARKALGVGEELTGEEKRILERAIQVMILRAAIVAGDSNQELVAIDRSNLSRH